MNLASFSLEGKVAIVTGGKRGIGKAIALAFAGVGADVAVCTRAAQDSELSAVASEIQKLGRRSLAMPADITRKADVDNLVETVMNKFGRIDVLVNNAGNLIKAPILELTEDDWDKTIDTHLKGYYFCCQAVGRKMVEQKRGSIINIASTWAMKAAAGGGAYCVAKAGVVMMTKVLALELARYNIRANAIAPGAVRTKMVEHIWSDPVTLKQKEATIPLGRIAEPDDIARTALFLASDASSYITGYTILVDGGALA